MAVRASRTILVGNKVSKNMQRTERGPFAEEVGCHVLSSLATLPMPIAKPRTQPCGPWLSPLSKGFLLSALRICDGAGRRGIMKTELIEKGATGPNSAAPEF